MEIVFFSEGNQHTRFFEPVLNNFIEKNYDVTLITLDENDNLIQNKNLLNVEIPKNNIEKINILKSISADYFFTTTPGLGHSYFPKSKIWPSSNRPKYVYLFHSLVSPNEMYLSNSFKNFDIIFSPSERIKENLSFLVPNSLEIIVSGYTLFEKKEDHKKIESPGKNVLIAPTWGDKGLINDINSLKKLKEFFYDKGYEVVIRPHPMTFENENLISKLNHFNLDTNHAVDNFNFYEFLITDYSGIAIEYYFFTENPTLFINSSKKIKRKIKKHEKSLLLIENEMREILGNTVELESDKIKIPMIKDIEKAKTFVNSFYNKESSIKIINDYLFKN